MSISEKNPMEENPFLGRSSTQNSAPADGTFFNILGCSFFGFKFTKKFTNKLYSENILKHIELPKYCLQLTVW